MKNRLIVCGIGALMLTANMETRIAASDPVGIYAIVERVVIEPNVPNVGLPRTLIIFGAFSMSVTPSSRSYRPEEAYGPVQRGYLYFRCPADKFAACAAEWNDLKAVAGKNEVVGFGSSWEQRPFGAPRVRGKEAPTSPDLYPVNIGVIPVGRFGAYPTIVAALKSAIGGGVAFGGR